MCFFRCQAPFFKLIDLKDLYLFLCLFRAWLILKTEIKVLPKWRLVARKRTDSHFFYFVGGVRESLRCLQLQIPIHIRFNICYEVLTKETLTFSGIAKPQCVMIPKCQ